jgi:hypothetical protein
VSSQSDWLGEAFFDDPLADSLDGGTTNRGALWHAVSPRWGHSMHSMCSYHGMFPPRLAHYFIWRYSNVGDLVVDPFSGRGTTTLQAKVEGRRTVGNDLSPLGYVLSAAKANPPSWMEMNDEIGRLERLYRRRSVRDPDVSEDIRMLFHENTLRQLCFLRHELLKKPLTEWSPRELMIAGAVSGILHGGHRSDGSSMYLSISMPNTFSMPPAYIKKYVRENGLKKIDQDVFICLRDKIARIYMDSISGPPGRTYNDDAGRVLSGSSLKPGSADLILTSPPYLQVVNYGTSNWIRLWWLGIDDVSREGGAGRRSLDAVLDHGHAYASYREFVRKMLSGVRRSLTRDGVAVIVIGDVITPEGSSYDLANRVWSDIGDSSGLKLIDLIEDSVASQTKVSKIWGETKGQATNRDCVLVLRRGRSESDSVNECVEWDEPYKDGGPDAAHERARRYRIGTRRA